MNEDMEFRMKYKETFTEVHAPTALGRKVMNMKNTDNKKFGFPVIKKMAIVASLALVVFIGSNGVTYAATGSTWIEKVIVYFNGSGYEAEINGEAGEEIITYSITDVTPGNHGTMTDLTEESPWITEEYNVKE